MYYFRAKAGVTAVEIFNSRRSRKKRQKQKKNRKAGGAPSSSQTEADDAQTPSVTSDFQFNLSANPLPKTSIQPAAAVVGGSAGAKKASNDGDVAMSDA